MSSATAWDDFAAVPDVEIVRADGTTLHTLSASAISRLLTCPEQYRQSYMLGNWPRPLWFTVLGSAYHHARRINYEQKVFSGEDLPIDEVLTAYAEGWIHALRDDIQWRDQDSAEAFSIGADMTRVYHEKVSPTVKPVAVEERFELKVPGVPLLVKGVIDVRDERMVLIDTKTQDKGAKQPKPDWRPQAFIYCAARPGYDFEWHVQSRGNLACWTPLNAPQLRMANTAPRRRAAERLVQHAYSLLVDLYGRYGLDEPWPGNGLVHGFACKGCSYRSRCFWWL